MKKNILLLKCFFFALTLLSHTAFSQVPQAIPYQAVARNNQGATLTNQSISLRFSLRNVTATGTIVYQETQNVNTNSLGLFSINLGQGIPIIGTMNAVDWKNGAKFLQVELDATGGTSYTDMGTTQLMSVPYALHAESSANDKWSQNGSNISNINTGNIGIGTNTPAEKLEVNGKTKTTQLQITSNAGANKILVSDADGNANWSTANTIVSGTLDQAYDFGGPGLGRTIIADSGALRISGEDGLLITGTVGSGDSVNINGGGTRMFYNPKKAAFRAGGVTGNRWDNPNIGVYSTALGFNNKASGNYSTAMGSATDAIGVYSTSMGVSTNANGDFSTAMGESTNANGNNSTAMGESTNANGNNSTAIGNFTNANGYTSTAMGYLTNSNGHFSTAMGENTIANGLSTLAIGRYNDSLLSSQASPTSTTPLFIIGNGSSAASRSNAMVVRYDGKVGIGINTPSEKLEVNGKIKTTELQITSNAGLNKVLVSDANGNATWNNVSTIASGTLDQAYDFGGPGLGRTIVANTGALKVTGDDGLLVTGTFGSGDNVEISGAGTRMFFNPRKAAFRAGRVTSTQWDSGIIGDYSTAFGHDVIASGNYSTALGNNTYAIGDYSTAMGIATSADGISSTAIGYYTEANGQSSTAMGAFTNANADNSTAIGIGTSANGDSSIAMGTYSQANGDNSTAMGYNTNANGRSSTSIGEYTIANGRGTLAIGLYNDSLVSSQTSTTSSTPLFIIGNGTQELNRSNAMVVRFDGKVGLGTNTPQSRLDVEGGLTVGATYAGTNAAPTNGAIIQGKVGIGTNSPASSLHIEGGTDVSLTSVGYMILGDEAGTNIAMDNNEIMCRSNGAASDIYIQQDGGRVAIGSTGVPTHLLQVDGVARSTSISWAISSDQRVKKNVNSLPNTSLQKIMQLRPVTYQWTDNYFGAFKGLKQNNTGFISQELEQVFPEMIEQVQEKFGDETISDFRLLNLSDLPIHIVKAMQEQQAQIEKSNDMIEALQMELANQKEILKQIVEAKQLIKAKK